MSGNSRIDRTESSSGPRGMTPPDPANATVLQKRQFMNRIAQRTGQRNADIRDIVEATLAELGEAIAAGQTLALPPLGRARINRQKDVSGSEVIVLRLRRRKGDIASAKYE